MTCVLGDVLNLTLTATIESSPARYDIGLWINETGGSALSDPGGTCYRDYLAPRSVDNVGCSQTFPGPYFNGETGLPNDTCGDVPATNGSETCGATIAPCTQGGGTCLFSSYEFTASFECSDSDSDGVADLGTCTSWDNNVMDNCASELDTDPGTGSKCNCNAVAIGNVFIDPCEAANCDDGIACTVDACDSSSGSAVCTNTPDDAVCDDGVACTDDVCDAISGCVNTPSDGSCTDGQFCNGDETCDALAGCQAGTAPGCDDGVACTDDSCDEVGDQCLNVTNDGNCTDGQFCNGDETCDALAGCQAGTAPDCDDGVACTDDSCDEVGDQCLNVTNDGNCTDGQFCNGDETCDPFNGCQAGLPPSCEDGVACTEDSCDEVGDQCLNVTNDGNCTDGQFCNGDETCDALAGCQAGTAPDCDDGVLCTVDACDETGGTCLNTPNDALCDDSLFCNGGEICDPLAGCQGGTAPDCDDGTACTDDSCNEATDTCDNVPDNLNCSDGEFCTGVEICDPQNGCLPGVDPCPGAQCDELGDMCVGCLSDVDCDDSVFCNGAEVCDIAGNCQPGAPPDCEDGVACTTDACDEMSASCQNAAVDALCDDSLFCNGAEVCDPLTGCQAGTAPGCDDGVACTNDGCDEATDMCENVAEDTGCDDELFCNGPEVCDVVAGCQPGLSPSCDDGITCTVDSCNTTTDACSNIAINTGCDNGQFCDGTEICDPLIGCQAGTAVDCSDVPALECGAGFCDEVTDSCVVTPINDGDPCDDGDACTTTDFCATGFCVGAGTLCGNGTVDAVCGEVCEPGAGEICNDSVDNDFDGLVDCADPDCCEDLVQQGCGLDCQPAAFCKAILNDPAVIKLNGTGADFFKFHGRVAVNPAVLNPLVDGFSVQLSNSSGIIYSGTLLPGDMIAKSAGRYFWKDKSAKNGVGVRDGLFRVRGVVRKFDNSFFYTIKVKAYGDLSAAVEPTMTTQISGVNDVAVLTATWVQKKSGWVLRIKDLLAGASAFQCNDGP